MTGKTAFTNRVLEVDASLTDGGIVTAFDLRDIAVEVMERKRIVVLKKVFPPAQLAALRAAVAAWGRTTEAAPMDDFSGNYHRRRAMVSRLQQAPHVFHDYNFHAFGGLPAPLEAMLRALFDPLRLLYNALTSRDTGFVVPRAGPYVHPQIIQYPNGGGFFGRHWHGLFPQQLGFIVALSEFGRDFTRGATVFEIDGEIVDMEGRQGAGDICIWRYDHPHWVTQSELSHKFDWEAEDGRWVATFAYFDPKG
jgi:hypothetical protein